MINFVVTLDGWVLEKLARNFADGCRALGEEVVVGDAVVPNATNVYFPYYLMKGKTQRDVALFTHREIERCEASRAKARDFDTVAEFCDVAWAMSDRTRQELVVRGRLDAITIEPPADPVFYQENLVLGVCGIEQPFNRKRLDMVERLQAIPGVKVRFTGGQIPQERMPDWFSGISYLVVLSENEGGPMGVKEAIAMGKPVIAPDVGWCWDYPCIEYIGVDHLERIVRQLAPKPGPDWTSACQKLILACRGKQEEKQKWLI